MRISDWSSDVCSSDLSLKLFLASYRNHGGFHEACTVAIARRLVYATAPRWLRIGGYWYPRGGDRKSVVEGKRVSVRVDFGGRRIITKKVDTLEHARLIAT